MIDAIGKQKQTVEGRRVLYGQSVRDLNPDLRCALTRIQRRYGVDALDMANQGSADPNRLSTGSLSLDQAIGGGIPLGRVTEIFGPEGTGKTTIALNIIGEAQKLGGIGLFIDSEHAFSPSYASSLGIDLQRLLICRPDCAETALSVIQEVLASQIVSVVVIDSVAALVPRVERESTFSQPGPDDLARLLSAALRKLVGPLRASGVALILLNQLRSKVGALFGNPETTPGGRAIRYYSSLRLEVRKVSAVKDTSQIVGSRIAVHVVKSKVSAPQSPIELEIHHGRGICYEADLIDAGLTAGAIEKRGGRS
jgi:recombination protein RecA